MIQALYPELLELSSVAVALAAIGLLGLLMIGRDVRADTATATVTATWVWDSLRVEQFFRWLNDNAETKGTEWTSRRVDSHSHEAQISEDDLLSFDILQLRGLQAKEIELVLLGIKCDKRLREQIKVIEASIGRRRARIANAQRTPGIALASFEHVRAAPSGFVASGNPATQPVIGNEFDQQESVVFEEILRAHRTLFYLGDTGPFEKDTTIEPSEAGDTTIDREYLDAFAAQRINAKRL